MTRTHKQARSDHDELSLRVAHQMQHAAHPIAQAQGSDYTTTLSSSTGRSTTQESGTRFSD
jgi:hypothetical protein